MTVLSRLTSSLSNLFTLKGFEDRRYVKIIAQKYKYRTISKQYEEWIQINKVLEFPKY